MPQAKLSDRLTLPPTIEGGKIERGEHQKLRNFLSNTIGDAVVEEMDKREGFHRAGNPGYDPEADLGPEGNDTREAATVEPVKADPDKAVKTVVADKKPVTDPAKANPGGKRKVLGKYDSEEEAEAGYHSLIRVNKTVLAENDHLSTELKAANEKLASLSALTPVPVKVDVPDTSRSVPNVRSTQREEFLKSMQDTYAIDSEDMNRLFGIMDSERVGFEARAREIARDEFAKTQAPEKMYNAADAYMQANYPDSFEFKDELTQFAAGDPELKAAFARGTESGDLRLPMELAWLKFKFNSTASAEKEVELNSEIREEEKVAARKDAGLITTHASGVHETPASEQTGLSKADFERLKGMWHAGYKTPLLRATIGKTLPDAMFGIE